MSSSIAGLLPESHSKVEKMAILPGLDAMPSFDEVPSSTPPPIISQETTVSSQQSSENQTTSTEIISLEECPVPSELSQQSKLSDPLNFLGTMTIATSSGPPDKLRSISAGVYRSGYPFPEHHQYIKKTLKLKTILTLVEPFRVPRGGELSSFCKTMGITQHMIPMAPTNLSGGISIKHMNEAMKILLDKSKHPILVHCVNGIHRTGVVIGVFQRLTGQLSTKEIHMGYDLVADLHARENDKVYIANIDVSSFEGCRVIGTNLGSELGAAKVLTGEDVGKRETDCE